MSKTGESQRKIKAVPKQTADPSGEQSVLTCVCDHPAVSKPAQRVFKVNMMFPTSVLCNDAGQGVLRQKVRNAVNSLNRDWNFCSYSVEDCMLCVCRVGRQARQTGNDMYNVEVSFPAVNDPVINSNNNERSSVQRLLEKLILEEDQFDVHDILPNTVPDPASLQLESAYACPTGQVVVAPDCVPCAVGTFFDKVTRSCVPCPLNSYQSESGQLQCTPCPNIGRDEPGVTIAPGARSAQDCKVRCPAGKYFDSKAELQCTSCGHGFYQPNKGSFNCLLCGLGKTTRTTEAVSEKECYDECGSGMQLALEGTCEPCPRGTYKAQGVQVSCQACPLGRITPKLGSVSIEECSLPVCPPGTYLNGTQNSCVACRKGTYQPEPQQTRCLSCPPEKSTKSTAATSASECFNPCEIRGPDMLCDRNARCLSIPETDKIKCECRPGYNGTGEVCSDVCTDFCDNEGVCVKDPQGQPSCRCIGSFTGKHCVEKSEFAYIAGGIAGAVIFIILIVLLVWMICVRSARKKEPKKILTAATDQNGSQVNFYYGAQTPYAESIAPSHHSTYAHYYDDEEDGWEMPNFYNETYMKETRSHNKPSYSPLSPSLERGVYRLVHYVATTLSTQACLDVSYRHVHYVTTSLATQACRNQFVGPKHVATGLSTQACCDQFVDPSTSDARSLRHDQFVDPSMYATSLLTQARLTCPIGTFITSRPVCRPKHAATSLSTQACCDQFVDPSTSDVSYRHVHYITTSLSTQACRDQFVDPSRSRPVYQPKHVTTSLLTQARLMCPIGTFITSRPVCQPKHVATSLSTQACRDQFVDPSMHVATSLSTQACRDHFVDPSTSDVSYRHVHYVTTSLSTRARLTYPIGNPWSYVLESLHNGGKMNSLARSNASIYGNKEDLYDRLKRHAYPGKKELYLLAEKGNNLRTYDKAKLTCENVNGSGSLRRLNPVHLDQPYSDGSVNSVNFLVNVHTTSQLLTIGRVPASQPR
uniref:EGF-like domain-containing protein n=1 Tax=Timema shepardi TaxID=629360 RepID=A0A7R9APS3_TIMSH|nr:unnamed protein product [Timema shepardi]